MIIWCRDLNLWLFPSLLTIPVYNRQKTSVGVIFPSLNVGATLYLLLLAENFAAGRVFRLLTSPPSLCPATPVFTAKLFPFLAGFCYFGHSVAVHRSADRRVHSALHSASRRSKGSYSGLCCCSDDDNDDGTRLGFISPEEETEGKAGRHVALKDDGSFTHVRVTVSGPKPLLRPPNSPHRLQISLDGFTSAWATQRWNSSSPPPSLFTVYFFRIPTFLLLSGYLGPLGWWNLGNKWFWRTRIHSTPDKWERKRTVWRQDHVIKADTNKAAKILSKK